MKNGYHSRRACRMAGGRSCCTVVKTFKAKWEDMAMPSSSEAPKPSGKNEAIFFETFEMVQCDKQM